MASFVQLSDQESLEIAHEDSKHSKVAAEDSPLSAIFHSFERLVTAQANVRVCPVATTRHFSDELLHITQVLFRELA